jgi:hypothetical protein
MMPKLENFAPIDMVQEGYFYPEHQTGVPEYEPLPDEEPEHAPDREPKTIPDEPGPKPNQPVPEPDMVPAAINPIA